MARVRLLGTCRIGAQIQGGLLEVEDFHENRTSPKEDLRGCSEAGKRQICKREAGLLVYMDHYLTPYSEHIGIL